jgi:hypothetical protein
MYSIQYQIPAYIFSLLKVVVLESSNDIIEKVLRAGNQHATTGSSSATVTSSERKSSLCRCCFRDAQHGEFEHTQHAVSNESVHVPS